MKNEIPWKLVAVGIGCLTIIQIVAMMYGINGTFRTMIAIVIAAAIGVTVPLDKFINTK